jgi:hypothetical protein
MRFKFKTLPITVQILTPAVLVLVLYVLTILFPHVRIIFSIQ